MTFWLVGSVCSDQTSGKTLECACDERYLAHRQQSFSGEPRFASEVAAHIVLEAV